jgi:predicted MFS family arabinose efflux permease
MPGEKMHKENAPMPGIVHFMAVAAGVAAANLYYVQPLLPAIGSEFGIPDTVGFLPAAIQAGFATGILCILPLGDIVERRRLLMTMLSLASCALLLFAAAPTPALLFLAALFVGLVGVTPQLLAPFSTVFAPKGMEGAAVGTVLSGVLSGVLLSRVVAGLIAQVAGWRGVFAAACVVAVALAYALRRVLPESRGQSSLTYASLVASIVLIFREEPRLRRHALYGAATFAAFMTFWSTYALHLHETFGFGPATTGLFGLAGLAGILAAPAAGRLVDRGRYRVACVASASLMAGGFILLPLVSASVVGILIGVLLIDAGAGICHAANQSAALALRPAALSRVNSIYIASYFAGGAIGTLLAGMAYAHFGWIGACAVGLGAALVMLIGETAPGLRDRLKPLAPPRP